METADIPERQVSSWFPMKKPSDIAVIGKLLEELGELAAIAARCMIQGIHENHPETDKPNREALGEELADVAVLIHLMITRFNFTDTVGRMEMRGKAKSKYLETWLRFIDEANGDTATTAFTDNTTRDEALPAVGQAKHCGYLSCPFPSFEVNYGMVGGGLGVYEYCPACGKVVAKTKEKDSI